MYHHEGLAIDDHSFNLVGELRGGITAPKRQVDVCVRTLVYTCPCRTLGNLGVEFFGREEAVIDSYIAFGSHPANETTVLVTFFALKAAIELTVLKSNIGTTYAPHEATVVGSTIIGCSKSDR